MGRKTRRSDIDNRTNQIYAGTIAQLQVSLSESYFLC
jgi:hypothetical protein